MIIYPYPFRSFDLFGFDIRFYSICMFLAIISAFLIAYGLAGKISDNTNKDTLLDFFPWLFISGISGARIYYVILSFNYYFSNPHLIFQIWRGGISIHGAIIFGIIAGIVYFKIKKLKFYPYADIIAIGLSLGQCVGRFGNFFNQEAFGVPVYDNFFIKLFVEKRYRPLEYVDYGYFHPVFLYESILDFLIFIALFFVLKKTANKFDGLVFYLYIILYSIVRAFLEFLRLDTVLYLFGVPFPFLVSIIGIFAGLIGIYFIYSKKLFND